MEEKQERFDAFSKILEAEITESSMCYYHNNDHPPKTGWNQPTTNFGCTMNSRPECILAFTLESAYFGTEENMVSTDRLIELGRCFAKAIRKYALCGNGDPRADQRSYRGLNAKCDIE